MTSSTFSPNSERDALLILNAVSGFSNRRIVELIRHCGSARKIFELPTEELSLLGGVSGQAALNLRHFSAEEFLKKEEAAILAEGARVVTFLDDDYPLSLRDIPDPPVVLYLSGAWPEGLASSVAVVGSRHPTLYGMETAERFARDLSEMNLVIVSGMARGIDAAAHRGCLRIGGKTVAVLGSGLDIVYPRENQGLFEKIKETGTVVSEFPLGTEPLPYNFPRRNRIVSGLSLGVLVVEANIKSGALITAEFALEQGKEVFAVPGRADSPLSGGPHALIRQGAKLVLSAGDILDELPIESLPKAAEHGHRAPVCGLDALSEEESRLMEILTEESRSLDELEARTGLSVPLLMPTLLSLQMRRMLRERPGKVYEVFK